MKKMLLLSLLVLQAYAADQSSVDALVEQPVAITVDQSEDDLSLNDSYMDTTSNSYTGAADPDESSAADDQAVIIVTVDQSVEPSSTDVPAMETAPACTGLCPLRPLCNKLIARLTPAGLGVLSGTFLACMETELVSPLLARCSDPVAIGIELGLFGALGYAAYTNEDNETIQELKTPEALLGMLAGIIVWNSLHS